jgi:hypothetical protein
MSEQYSQALVSKIVSAVRRDEIERDEWFLDDKGGVWLKDSPANPYGKNYDPNYVEPEYKPWLDGGYVKEMFKDIKTLGYVLLHEYGHMMEHERDHMKAFTIQAFAKAVNLDFQDICEVLSKHPNKPKTAGLSKLTKEFQGVSKQVKRDMVLDYIEMQKELGFPLVNEDKILEADNRGYLGNIEEFWFTYGAMACVVNGEDGASEWGGLCHYSALIRFSQKISNDMKLLYPLLAHLFNAWADNKEFLEDWRNELGEWDDSIRSDGTHATFSDLGFEALMWADSQLNPLWAREDGKSFNDSREKDYLEFQESAAESLGAFIRDKYYSD